MVNSRDSAHGPYAWIAEPSLQMLLSGVAKHNATGLQSTMQRGRKAQCNWVTERNAVIGLFVVQACNELLETVAENKVTNVDNGCALVLTPDEWPIVKVLKVIRIAE